MPHEVRALGGLYVLGTERHESRRIDNQLRGRSGRQGDPGESRFYLSLEDELLRLFATGAVSWVMDRTMPEDEAIEAKMVSRAIERAQNTVEGRNAEIRKDVLKYDEVMNEQRNVIYKRRAQIIDGEDIHDETLALIQEVIEAAVLAQLDSEYSEEWDLGRLLNEMLIYFPARTTVEELSGYEDSADVAAVLVDEAVALYEARAAAFPGGIETAKEIERDVMLQVIDQRWREHLSDMDYLRDGIHLRQVAQQDPLTAWQKEGFAMFEHMLNNINADFVRVISHVEAVPAEMEEDPGLARAVTNAAHVAPGDVALPAHERPIAKPAAKGPNDKIGRNEPCWCGSGRKFKQCHGRP